MLCVLVFVGYGHAFVQGKGNWLYKACYYDCNATTHWYNRIHKVHYSYTCPATYRIET